jgi:hypothetical protein
MKDPDDLGGGGRRSDGAVGDERIDESPDGRGASEHDAPRDDGAPGADLEDEYWLASGEGEAGEESDEARTETGFVTESADSPAPPEGAKSPIGAFGSSMSIRAVILAAMVGTPLVKHLFKAIGKGADNIPWRHMDGFGTPNSHSLPLPRERPFHIPEGVRPGQLSEVVPHATPSSIPTEGLAAAVQADGSDRVVSAAGRVLNLGARAAARRIASEGSRNRSGANRGSPAPSALGGAWTEPCIALLAAGDGCSIAGASTSSAATGRAWGWDEHGLVSSCAQRFSSNARSGPAVGGPALLGLALGESHAVVILGRSGTSGSIRDGGSVIALGSGAVGQAAVPWELSNLCSIVQVAAGARHSLALDRDGTVYCWGDDRVGQCTPPATGFPADAISAGGDFSLAVTRTGSLVAWGDDSHGQCRPSMRARSVKFLDCGDAHAGVVTEANEVVCWGDDSYGQCGAPQLDGAVEALSLGGSHSMILLGDGRVLAFGLNDSGQCDVPELPEGRSAVAIAAGTRHSLLLTDHGEVVAWGSNAHGECDVPVELRVEDEVVGSTE